MKFNSRRGLVIERELLEQLRMGPKSCRELQILIPASQTGVRNALLRLQHRQRVHPRLAFDQGDRRFPIIVWALGAARESAA